MACTGYSPQAVKLPKSVKRVASTFIDAHQRGAFIRSYVAILQSELRANKRGAKDRNSK